MKNKRLIVALSLLCVAVVGFSGCGNKEADTPTTTETEVIEEVTPAEDVVEPTEPEVEQEETVENLETEEPVVDNTISDNWKDGEFLMDGVKIKMPCTTADLEKAGWYLEVFRDDIKEAVWKEEGGIDEEASIRYEASDFLVPANSSFNRDALVLSDLYPDSRMIAFLENPTDKEVDVADCIYTGLFIENEFYVSEDSINFYGLTLAKGITYGSTEEEVIAAYGEPSDSYDYGSSNKSMTYQSDDTYFRLDLSFEDGTVDRINLYWDEYLPY